MVQGTATQWLPVLLPGRLGALRALGEAPARSLPALAQRLGVVEAAAAPLVAPLTEEPAPVATVPAAPPPSPLVPMRGPPGAAAAPQPRLNSRRVRAARNRTIRSKMSCGGRPSSPASCCATPMAAAAMTSGALRPPRLRDPPGAGCCRPWAFGCARCPKSRSACRPRHPAARSCPGRRNWRTTPCTRAASGASTSTAGASAVALGKTGGAWGRRAAGSWGWHAAVPCPPAGCAGPRGSP
jgi:hypothetical protein